MIWNCLGAHADKADGPDLVVHVREHRVVGMAGVAGVVRGDPNGLGQQAVRLADHIIALRQLPAHEIARIALLADFDQAVRTP